jgi:hypothetical protein
MRVALRKQPGCGSCRRRSVHRHAAAADPQHRLAQEAENDDVMSPVNAEAKRTAALIDGDREHFVLSRTRHPHTYVDRQRADANVSSGDSRQRQSKRQDAADCARKASHALGLG